jgi:hypothetical protein
MKAGHESGVKLGAVTANDTPSNTNVAVRAGQARQHRLDGAKAGDDESPVSALGGAHDEGAAESGEEADGDGDHRRPVDVLHRREHVAAAGQPDEPRRWLCACDGARNKEERQHDQEHEQQRTLRLLAEPEPGGGVGCPHDLGTAAPPDPERCSNRGRAP